MTWGFFSPVHIASLVIAVGIIIGLYFLLKGKTQKIQLTVLGILSFAGIAAILYNLLAWGSPLEYLPLHLCSLNALVLPVAVWTRNKVLNNLLLLWSIGALFALLLNTSVAAAEICSWTFVFYYFPHVLELGIPIMMFLLKLVKKDVRCILSTTGITFSAYTLVYFINLWVNNYAEAHHILNHAGEIIKVNYMYSIFPANPLLNLFYKIIPLQYWYMYLSILVIVPYLSLIYLCDIIALVKARARRS